LAGWTSGRRAVCAALMAGPGSTPGRFFPADARWRHQPTPPPVAPGSSPRDDP
jgi:hypothetical protein